MTRELRFRCWNNCLREYIPEEELLEDFRECMNEDHLYIEQYTGLTDKNGKEIYEGDIIKDKDFAGKDWVATVSYDNQCAEFVCEAVGSQNVWPCSEIVDDDIEVIGNIHENPELPRGDNE